MDLWDNNPWAGWTPDPSGVPIPSAPPIPGLVSVASRLWLTAEERAVIVAASPLTCLYRDVAPVRNACLPWRCFAGRGSSCGGSHSDDAHCQCCLYPARP